MLFGRGGREDAASASLETSVSWSLQSSLYVYLAFGSRNVVQDRQGQFSMKWGFDRASKAAADYSRGLQKAPEEV